MHSDSHTFINSLLLENGGIWLLVYDFHSIFTDASVELNIISVCKLINMTMVTHLKQLNQN